MEADVIGGFPKIDPQCFGCGQPLKVENAWMTDGCPCNTRLGVNNMNETRWRLLMQLQQKQSRELAALRTELTRGGQLKEPALRAAEEILRRLHKWEEASKPGPFFVDAEVDAPGIADFIRLAFLQMQAETHGTQIR